ncbi:MAG: DUF1800 family protein [Verrucomicrobiales bacterium]|nr:DUF1800 family protein [Verrucomicrobiales bacterium]
MKERMSKAWWLMVIAAGVMAAGPARGAEPQTKAETGVEQAKKEEKAAYDEYYSREMARSATREIARSERKRAEDAVKNLGAAQEALKQAETAGQESEISAAHKGVADRLETLRIAAGRLIQDTETANLKSDELFTAELALRDKLAATRLAERNELEAEAKAKAEARAPDCEAAQRAVCETDAVRKFEIQQWAGIRKDTARELAEQSGEACRIAKIMAKAETEADRCKRLEQFAEQQAKVKADSDKVIAEADKAITAAVSEIYPLRAAAMGGLKPLAPDQWNYAKARHLLVRAGFGGSPQEVEKLCAMGLYKAVDHLVEFYRQPAPGAAFDPVPPLPVDPLEAKLRVEFMTGRVAGARRSVERGQVGRLRNWWLQRMVESPRPLQEKLTLFWHGHFANQDAVVQNSYAMYRQNQFFREHAAGNFGGLLYGIVHDPSMIRYLDNNKNVKGEPNENLAREIMELFSLGLDQGYTEKDIAEAARALTGYNYDDSTGGFRFLYSKHDTTDKTIFGQTGPWTGDDLVRLILDKPETARFIARKLWEFFAYTDPNADTVEPLATVLRGNRYALEPMLKNLFLSEEFYSPRAMGNQIKSPVELVVGLLRDLGVKQIPNYGVLDGAIQQMGMRLLEPPDVKGWRYGRSWISSQRLFVRYNTVADLVKSVTQPGGQKGADVLALLEQGKCEDAAATVDYLAKACLQRPLSDEKRKELIGFLGELPSKSEWADKRGELNEKLRALLVLMLSMPEYQMT